MRENVALQVLTSGEGYGDLIAAAYVKYLGRSVDAGGANFWLNALTHGTTDQQFYAALLGSNEYYAKVSG